MDCRLCRRPRAPWLLLLTLAVASTACDDDAKASDDGDSVVIGALYSSTSTDGEASIVALGMVVDDINASGIFTREFRLVPRFWGPDSDREAMARTLVTEDGAIAIVSQWSSTAEAILQVTSGDHPDHVSCSGSSTSAALNDPDLADADGAHTSDKNGTLYRTVANDARHGVIVWDQIPEPSRDKVGVLHIDDAFGTSFRDEIAGVAGGLAFVAGYPAEDFTTAAVEGSVNDILARNAAGELDTLVLVGSGERSEIMRMLTEAQPPFEGIVHVPEAAKEFFDTLGGGFAVWLGMANNQLISSVPDNYRGAHSDEWFARLQQEDETITRGAGNYFTTHADCAYAIAIALLHATGDAQYTPAGVKENLPRLRASQYAADDDVIDATPDPAGLAAAKAAIEAGKKVRLDGASGLVVFDEDGDRERQIYAVREAKALGGAFEWETTATCDGESEPGVPDCI